MKEKKDCKIIQDLLPVYIEKLTDQETNQYIEEHLKECDECQRVLQKMQKDLKLNNQKRDKREVKYIKKYKNRMRVLKVIILLILVIFMIITGRKIYILSDLYNKAETYSTSKNYHRTTYAFNKGTYLKTETFVLGDKIKSVTIEETGNKKIITTMFATKSHDDRYLVNTYIEKEDSKTVKLNQDLAMSYGIYNTLYTENLWQLFLYSIPASITNTTFDGNECYYVSNFQNPYTECKEGTYISRKTGLSISTIAYEVKYEEGTKERWPATEYVYEFDNVTGNDFTEPNIKEYEIQ